MHWFTEHGLSSFVAVLLWIAQIAVVIAFIRALIALLRIERHTRDMLEAMHNISNNDQR